MAASLGSFIRERRLALKKSGRQLARESGISSGYLSQIEAGRFIPKPALLRKLVGPLDTGYDKLLAVAGILSQSLSEESTEYHVGAGEISYSSGPRLMLPILGRVPSTVDGFPMHLGEVPYLDAAEFAVKVEDNSLSGINILPGDLIYITGKSKVKNGATVLAKTGGKIILRVYERAGKEIKLKAACGKFKDIVARDVEIIGVKAALLRR